jgi:hypothetical protein
MGPETNIRIQSGHELRKLSRLIRPAQRTRLASSESNNATATAMDTLVESQSPPHQGRGPDRDGVCPPRPPRSAPSRRFLSVAFVPFEAICVHPAASRHASKRWPVGHRRIGNPAGAGNPPGSRRVCLRPSLG